MSKYQLYKSKKVPTAQTNGNMNRFPYITDYYGFISSIQNHSMLTINRTFKTKRNSALS